MYHGQMSRALILAVTVCGLIAINVWVWRALAAPRAVVVESLAVGQGDALLVRAPGGHTLLVDTGADASILRALGETLPPWQRSLDALITLSANKKAVGGEPFVLERYRVGQVVQTPPGSGAYLSIGSLTLALSASTTPGSYSY